MGGAELHEPYATYVRVVSSVDLDVTTLLPLNCYSTSHFNHMHTLLSTTLFPVAVLAVAVATYSVTKMFKLKTDKDLDVMMKSIESYYTFFLILVYPAITRCICQSFRCTQYEESSGKYRSLLTADLSIGA